MIERGFDIDMIEPTRCVEITAFRLDRLNGAVQLPLVPGHVRRSEAERYIYMYHAPGRWLAACLMSPSGTGPALAPDAFAVVDVSGKWQLLRLAGADVEAVLRFQLPLTRTFANRACAATHVFNCPTIVAKHDNSYDLWTHSSYAPYLREALLRAHANHAAHNAVDRS